MQDRVFSNRSIVTISTMCAGPEFSNVANIGTRNPHMYKVFGPAGTYSLDIFKSSRREIFASKGVLRD